MLDVRRRGSLIIVSGPSGAGKTSVCSPLLERVPGIRVSVSTTTRRPRAGEREGVDYRFVDDAEFDRMVAAGEFAEWATVHGHRYGTARRPLEEGLEAGEDLLLDIDVQGARQIKAIYPGAVSIFLIPPSRNSLEQRLRSRGTDDEQTVRRRLEGACREIESAPGYDYLVVNDDLARTVETVIAIVEAERSRVERIRRDDLERLLADFRAGRG